MIIDLTHTIRNGIPVYPGSLSPEIEDLELYDEHGVHVQKITLDGHVGTHIDVPAHLFPNGDTTESMNISTFFGAGRVIDCTDCGSKGTIGTDILKQIDDTELPDFLLLYTGWSRLWNSEEYFNNFPVPSRELINSLADTNLKGIGLDTTSLDPVDSQDLPNHKKILGSKKIIIENLKNLEELIGKRFMFSCFPLKLLNGDGSPVRAVGIIDE